MGQLAVSVRSVLVLLGQRRHVAVVVDAALLEVGLQVAVLRSVNFLGELLVAVGQVRVVEVGKAQVGVPGLLQAVDEALVVAFFNEWHLDVERPHLSLDDVVRNHDVVRML